MLKYANYDIVTEEVPEEISLAINISGCPIKCEGCHSDYLIENIGKDLTFEELDSLINKNAGITCVALMGGDADPDYVVKLIRRIHFNHHLKTAWYSGRKKLPEIAREHLVCFNYIKLGPYMKNKGGLNSKETNQKMFKIGPDKKITNITSYFQKKTKD